MQQEIKLAHFWLYLHFEDGSADKNNTAVGPIASFWAKKQQQLFLTQISFLDSLGQLIRHYTIHTVSVTKTITFNFILNLMLSLSFKGPCFDTQAVVFCTSQCLAINWVFVSHQTSTFFIGRIRDSPKNEKGREDERQGRKERPAEYKKVMWRFFTLYHTKYIEKVYPSVCVCEREKEREIVES